MLGNYSVYFYPVQYLQAMHYMYMAGGQVMYNVLTGPSRKNSIHLRDIVDSGFNAAGKAAEVYFKCSPQHFSVACEWHILQVVINIHFFSF